MDWSAGIKHEELKTWISQIAELTTPQDIRVCDGSETEYAELCTKMVKSGTMIPLNPELHPNCFFSTFFS